MLTAAILTVFIVLIILAGLYILSTYNRLWTLKNRAKEAWSEVILKCR
jgi:LemA protein